VQCPDCTTFHFLWCLRIASFSAVTQTLMGTYSLTLKDSSRDTSELSSSLRVNMPRYFLVFQGLGNRNLRL